MRVHDAFLLNDEELLLRTRLELLGPVVDHFVIVESETTFTGRARELLLPRLEDLPVGPERITHVVVREEETRDERPSIRQRIQRDAILRGLGTAGGGDLVLVSDLDELPRPEVVERLATSLEGPVALGMRFSLYRLNLVARRQWTKARAVRRADLTSPEDLRRDKRLPVVEDAGWHVSYLGDEQAAVSKLGNLKATRFAGPRWSSPIHVRRCIRLGVRIQGELVLDVQDDAQCLPLLDRQRYPELFHPGKGRVLRSLAHVYRFGTDFRDRMPRFVSDRLPPIALVIAAGLWLKDAVVSSFDHVRGGVARRLAPER